MNDLTMIFKVLSDETRLRIVHALMFEELCVCEMTTLFQETQPKISKHLSKLKDIGLVDVRREDRFMYYRLSDKFDALNDLMPWLKAHGANHDPLKHDQRQLMDTVALTCVRQEARGV